MRLRSALFLFAASISIAESAGEIPAVSADEIDRIPDLTQTDPAGNFARGGKSYCGPVAASNSLMRLFGEQIKAGGMDQYDLVHLLASKEFMATDPEKGTGPNALMRGVRKLAETYGGGKPFRIRFQGWRAHRQEFSTGVAQPQLDWIKRALANGGAVWLNVGWYRHAAGSETYERIGGHWVTAVGYGVGEDGTPDPNILIIHDPSPRTGTAGQHEFAKLERIKTGKLTGSSVSETRDAKELFLMGGGMHIKSTADCAILDGVAALIWE